MVDAFFIYGKIITFLRWVLYQQSSDLFSTFVASNEEVHWKRCGKTDRLSGNEAPSEVQYEGIEIH